MTVGSFSTLTEFAVAIAGFSGIVIAVAGRAGNPSPVVWFRNLCLLSWAMVAAFASVVPPMAAALGTPEVAIWRWSSASLGTMVAFLSAVPFLAARRISRADREALQTYAWVLAIGGNAGVGAWQLANAAGLGGPPSAGPIFAGIVWLIAFSSLLFARMLATPPER